MRIFISLNPDRETRNKILRYQEKIKDQVRSLRGRQYDLLKWERPENFHVTVFFIGDADEETSHRIHAALSSVAGSLPAGGFGFAMKGVSAFPNLKFPRVIYLDAEDESKNSFRLAELISPRMQELGYKSDKPFTPHITLARVKRDRKVSLADMRAIEGAEFRFETHSFFLMKSTLRPEGSVYEVLHEYKCR